MDSSKHQQQEEDQQPQLNSNNNNKNNMSFNASGETAADRSWSVDLETDPSSIVTIFQRDHVEISEDDELADNLQDLSHHSVTCAIHRLHGELSSVSLPRVNRFCTKWLKQTNRSAVASQEPQEQPLSLSGMELSNQALLSLHELDKAIGQQPAEPLLECLKPAITVMPKPEKKL